MAKDFDIMQVVTDKIIEALEQGTAPWTKPWVGGGMCVKHRDGKPYSLLNQLLLGRAGEYLSYKEAEAEGGHVKKGAKGRFVVFWKITNYEAKDGNGNVMRDKDGKPIMKSIPFLRYYTVFHIDDCEGIEAKHADKEFEHEPIEKADGVLTDYAARCRVQLKIQQSGRAFYSPIEHMICIPKKEQFPDLNEYYSTAFHEATHSTGHHTLLDRFPKDAIMAAFGSKSYSKEELIAEIGACAIMNRLGIETENTFRNSAAYIDNWLNALKKDKSLIVSAAGKAQKAVALIMNDQDEAEVA